MGDYLLSRGLLTALENKHFDLLELLSTSVKEMSEGELMQLEKSRKLDISEADYFTIISQKLHLSFVQHVLVVQSLRCLQ